MEEEEVKIEVAEGHKFGMRVPHGGSNCAKCEYVSDDEEHCSNEYFQKWNKSNKLPIVATDYCCDAFQTKEGRKTAADHLKSQRARK